MPDFKELLKFYGWKCTDVKFVEVDRQLEKRTWEDGEST